MFRIVNGVDHSVPFKKANILREASFDDGATSIVFAKNMSKHLVISISNHECGDWDISINDEPYNSWNSDEASECVDEFMDLVRRHS